MTWDRHRALSAADRTFLGYRGSARDVTAQWEQR
jgi:hypothetical protein